MTCFFFAGLVSAFFEKKKAKLPKATSFK